MAWYRTGTVSVTNGSATVTGSGTLFVANVVAGYGIALPDGRLYEVASVNTNTSITITPAYLGSTASGQSYAIAPLRGPEVKLAQDIAALINDYGAAFLAAGQGKFTTGTIASPSVRNAADENTGLNLLGSDQLQLVTGGVARLLMTTSAATLNLPLGGTAVTQSALDTTSGRLLKTGDFGIGGLAGASIPSDDCDLAQLTGIYNVATSTTNTPAGTGPSGSMLLVQRFNADNIMQTVWRRVSANVVRIYVRNRFSAAWGAWNEIPTQMLGTVTQSGGTPTGALFEKGSNANGEYVRFADGTQICWTLITVKAAADATTGNKSVVWTYPAAFASAGTSSATASLINTNPTARTGPTTGNYTTTTVTVYYAENVGVASDVQARVVAIGRWF
jgi:hypothetical protein